MPSRSSRRRIDQGYLGVSAVQCSVLLRGRRQPQGIARRSGTTEQRLAAAQRGVARRSAAQWYWLNSALHPSGVAQSSTSFGPG